MTAQEKKQEMVEMFISATPEQQEFILEVTQEIKNGTADTLIKERVEQWQREQRTLQQTQAN